MRQKRAVCTCCRGVTGVLQESFKGVTRAVCTPGDRVEGLEDMTTFFTPCLHIT
jgi:hypothetical protein